jgi:hypothetical protein
VTRPHKRLVELARSVIIVHGVYIQWVSAEDDGDPRFAYTAGLAALDHPEFILFGWNPENSEVILNMLSLRVRDGVQRFDGPCDIPDFGNGFPVRLLPVENSSKHLTVANHMYRAAGKGPIPALQVVCPDPQRRWPWVEGSDYADHPGLWPDDFDVASYVPIVDLVPHEPT